MKTGNLKVGKKFALVALLVVSVLALSPGALLAQDVELHPTFGIPFATDGGVGTIELKGFVAEGNNIVTNSVIRIGQTAKSAVLPVKIVRATCSGFELEIGPPPGATRPATIIQDRGTSDLNLSEFCDLANAESVQAQVTVLNQEGRLAAEQADCPWYDALGCAVAVTVCGATCILGPEVCIPCLAGIGASACLDCFFGG